MTLSRSVGGQLRRAKQLLLKSPIEILRGPIPRHCSDQRDQSPQAGVTVFGLADCAVPVPVPKGQNDAWRGLIDRFRTFESRRISFVYLNVAKRAKAEELPAIVECVYSQVIKDLSKKDQKAVIGIL